MEEYLKKYGFTPSDMGLDSYFANASNSVNMPKESKFNNTMLKNLPLTMAYVPFQQIEGPYNQDDALKNGLFLSNKIFIIS